ncbi:MAG: hypothetical protein WCT07_04845 [Candidatus Paceibacterota bacterium]|jgi:predicted ribosomally synthesized peptide with SipW-like signal peptide
MKKIVASFLSIALIIALVSSSAHALFSSTTNVNGLTFSTGNADLQISSIGTTWGTTLILNPDYTNMLANFTNSQEFYLKNNSLSNIDLSIFTRLIDNNASINADSWAIIGDKINISFERFDGSNWIVVIPNTLIQWRDTGFSLNTLSIGTTQKYRINVTTNNLDNNDAGQSLSNLSFQFTGTQL